jgi:dipeptidyl aminopeptidase/acylaminoacyl peptidase
MRERPEPTGALPFDLAFDTREFPWSSTLSVTRDGRRVAYTVRRAPGNVNLSTRFQPNGTPSSVVGGKVYVTDRQTAGGRTTEVCPGGNCWGPSLSPNGDLLAFYSDKDGPPQLWVFDVATQRTRKASPVRIKAKLWTGDEAQWSPDSRTIYVPTAPDTGDAAWLPPAEVAPTPAPAPNAARPAVSVLRGGSEEIKSTKPGESTPRQTFYYRENNAAITTIDVRTGVSRLLVAATATPRPSVLRLSASGRWVSYLSVFKDHGVTNQSSSIDLAVVPAAGGTPRVIAADLPLLNDYHGRNYAWSPTDDALVYLKEGQLWLVPFGSNGPNAPVRLGASLGALAPTYHWFTRDGKAVVVGTDPIDDKGYGDPRPRGLAVVPLDGAAPSRIAVDSAWAIDDLVRADPRTLWQPDGASVTALLTDVATGERAAVRFDTRSGAPTTLWKGRARLANVTGDATHQALYALYQDIGTPPNVYRFPADFSRKERVSHADDRLDAVAVGSADVFETSIPGYNGSIVKARTAVLLPPGAKRGDRLPAVVLMYPGGDRSRQAEVFGGGGDLTIPTLLFTSRGYAVVLASLPLGPNREAGNPLNEMIDELLPQVYRAANLGYVDINRLAIAGQSFGGYGTGAIISGTNLFRAAVAVSGIYDLAGTYGYLDESGGSFWIGWSEGGQARMGTHPWANITRYLENSPYYRADRIHTPLLLVHGDKDNAYHDAQKLFTALRRLDRPVQLATYGGMGHVIYEWTRPNAVDAARRIVAFVSDHLGEPAKTPVTPQ